MRRLTVVVPLVALVVAAATVSAPAAPAPATTFVLAGGGWGHGVGMSQWGAFGQAKAGRPYKEILGTYFPGTALGAPAGAVPDKVRVLVGDGLASVAVTSTSPIAAVDGAGKRYRLGAAVTVGRPLELPVGKDGAAKAVPPPLTLQPTDGATLVAGGKTYRGSFEVS
ncbi:MAG TPA: hypothetical protein VFQ28_09585, partial [Gaiella sp.]|nr:hypothetical protein [Gaiella sp.]